jgi:hypothetical protein
LLAWVQTKDKEFNSLFRYVRNCDYCHDFLHKGLLRTRKVLKQGFLVVKLRVHLLLPRLKLNIPAVIDADCIVEYKSFVVNTSSTFLA